MTGFFWKFLKEFLKKFFYLRFFCDCGAGTLEQQTCCLQNEMKDNGI